MSVTTYQRKMGQNRGVARVWVEGACLAKAGWSPGDRFNVDADPKRGLLIYEKAADGKRKVAGKGPEKPIIDTNTAKLVEWLGCSPGALLDVTCGPSRILIMKAEGGAE